MDVTSNEARQMDSDSISNYYRVGMSEADWILPYTLG
jgi:hypothetical protein